MRTKEDVVAYRKTIFEIILLITYFFVVSTTLVFLGVIAIAILSALSLFVFLSMIIFMIFCLYLFGFLFL